MTIMLVAYVLIIAFLGWTWFFILAGGFLAAMALLCLIQKRRAGAAAPN
jgi:hypothetical protein